MATTAYSNDNDLVKIRPNILDLGVSDWGFQHKEAFSIINRILTGKWYIQAATDQGVDWRAVDFDPDKIEAGMLVRASCYKTLEMAYLYLMKDAPEPDGFEREMKLFTQLFNTEMNQLLGLGINYDWDESGDIDESEKYQRSTRRLVRV